MSTTSETEKTPAVSRPEGDWREGDAVLIDGDNLWTRSEGRWQASKPGHRKVADAEIDVAFDQGLVAYVHAPREPEPVMEPLPTEPCAIRAKVRGARMHLVGPGEDDEWRDDLGRCWWANVHEITSWEPLLSRAEWEAEQAERDGDTVRVPREAVERLRERIELWRDGGMYCGLPSTIIDFLDTVDAERGDQA